MGILLRVSANILGVVAIALGAFHLRQQHLMERPLPEAPPAAEGSEALYFAYGATMSSRHLYSAHDIRPAQSQRAEIADHELAFLGPGLNDIEPAEAYLVPSEGRSAHGVLHRLSEDELERIRESGRGRGEWTTVLVKTDDGEVHEAETLVRAGGDTGRPSERYLHLVLEGAREHELPYDYVVRLRDIRPVYVPVLSELMGDALHAVALQRSGRCTVALFC